jgi:hypothetical protein
VADRVANYRSSKPRPSAGLGKRLVWILVIGLITAAVISLSTGRTERRSAAPPPGPEPMAGMSAKRLQTHAAENGIVAGAGAAQKALAAARIAEERAADPNQTAHINSVVAPNRTSVVSVSRSDPEDVRGKPKPAIRITRVRSNAPHPTQAKALNDALVEAQSRIAERLRSLDEPIHQVPPVEVIRTEYLKPDSVAELPLKAEDRAELEAKGIDSNRVWVEIDVELSESQVRQLRSTSRLEGTGLIAGVAFVLVLALFGFLRLDAWTKGYLTAGIGIAVAAAAGGALALLFLTR